MPNEPDAELLRLINGWAGAEVAVRVVATQEDQLIGIFWGRLLGPSQQKHPALFWPLDTLEPAVEQPGIYLHPDSYGGFRIHEGGFVVEFDQAGVTTNIRHLG